MDHKTVAEEWFQFANSDFEAAKYLQSMRPVPLNLTDYGIQTRYPFELEINEEDMNSAIQSAARIQKFVMRFIK